MLLHSTQKRAALSSSSWLGSVDSAAQPSSGFGRGNLFSRSAAALSVLTTRSALPQKISYGQSPAVSSSDTDERPTRISRERHSRPTRRAVACISSWPSAVAEGSASVPMTTLSSSVTADKECSCVAWSMRLASRSMSSRRRERSPEVKP